MLRPRRITVTRTGTGAGSPAESRSPSRRPAPRVLIAEDESNGRRHLADIFESEGYEIDTARSAEEVLRKVDSFGPHLVVADVSLPGASTTDLASGVAVEPHVSGEEPPALIVLASRGETAAAIAAMRAGAAHSLSRPLCRDEVLMAAERVLERRALAEETRRLRARLSTRTITRTLVGTSPEMQNVMAALEEAATSAVAPVLVTGEPGTGKSLVAELVHRASERRVGPLVRLVCTADEAAAVLFDEGALGAAAGGTLLLEDVTELDPDVQVRLATAFADRPAGAEVGPAKRRAARLVATTRRDPHHARARGFLVPELHHLLPGIVIALPPLRRRPGDIPLLADYFLRATRDPARPGPPGFTGDALERLASYDWPGNLHELSNAVARAADLAGVQPIESRHLGAALVPDRARGRPPAQPPRRPGSKSEVEAP